MKSKRLQKALDKFQGRGSSESETESESTSGSESEGSKPASPKQGESVIKKANQILSGSTKGRGRGSGSQAASRGKRGDKSDGHKVDVKSQRARGRGRSAASGSRGRDGRSAQPQQFLLRDEVCLSESSSSSDDSLEKPQTKKPQTKKPQTIPGKPSATKPERKQQGSKPTAQRSAGMKKKSGSAPKANVRKQTPAAPGPVPSKRKREARLGGAKKIAAMEGAAAFREAMGGDLDPTTMTIDDLGSDFSDEDFNA